MPDTICTCGQELLPCCLFEHVFPGEDADALVCPVCDISADDWQTVDCKAGCPGRDEVARQGLRLCLACAGDCVECGSWMRLSPRPVCESCDVALGAYDICF